MKRKPGCGHCGIPWANHDGIARACFKRERARSALKVIHTWATADGNALDPQLVRDICKKTLEETK
jgi:hypothetical protein